MRRSYMKKKILIELYNVFESMKNIKNVEFMYLIIKNKFKIKDEIEIFSQLSQPSDEYIEYLKELEEIAYKYAERDENGNLVRTATGIKVKDKNISLADCRRIFYRCRSKIKVVLGCFLN